MKILYGLHIIRFDGGLGNQMFEYAFYLSLRYKNPFAVYAFDTSASDSSHNGYELDRVFYIDSSRECNRYAFLYKLERHHYVDFTEVSEENAIVYESNVYSKIWHSHIYIGYWQTEKYFKHITTIVRNAFRFREELLSKKTKQMMRIIRESKNAISLHVRRGDYVGIGNTKTFGMEYYDAAVKKMREKYKDATLFVFSDDPEWVRKNLLYENMMVVDWNIGKDAWQDMYLMSQCQHNIIANSSFSWWGAWLNSNPDKIVVAPKKWMTWEPEQSDIIPNSWLRL